MAAIDGKAEQAARLFGAAEALYEPVGFQLPHHDPQAYEPALAAVRAALDETAVARAWTQGRSLLMEQAVAEATAVADALAGSQS